MTLAASRGRWMVGRNREARIVAMLRLSGYLRDARGLAELLGRTADGLESCTENVEETWCNVRWLGAKYCCEEQSV